MKKAADPEVEYVHAQAAVEIDCDVLQGMGIYSDNWATSKTRNWRRLEGAQRKRDVRMQNQDHDIILISTSFVRPVYCCSSGKTGGLSVAPNW